MKKFAAILLVALMLFAVSCTDEKSLPDNLSMSLWADGVFEECADFKLLADYAIYLGAGTDTYEVTVLKAKEQQDL